MPAATPPVHSSAFICVHLRLALVNKQQPLTRSMQCRDFPVQNGKAPAGVKRETQEDNRPIGRKAQPVRRRVPRQGAISPDLRPSRVHWLRQPEGGRAAEPHTGATCIQPRRSGAKLSTSRRLPLAGMCRTRPHRFAEAPPGRTPSRKRQMKIRRFVILWPPTWSGLYYQIRNRLKTGRAPRHCKTRRRRHPKQVQNQRPARLARQKPSRAVRRTPNRNRVLTICKSFYSTPAAWGVKEVPKPPELGA